MKFDGFFDDARLKNEIQRHIRNGTYRLTKHAAIEQSKDGLSMPDTLQVLKTGFHESKKTTFSNKFQKWNYAIRGKTEDLKDVRVIISFTDEMMIVTVMEL
jgi:hypothetical protein